MRMSGLALLLIVCGSAVATETTKPAKPPDPAYAQIEDRPGLPRVLLIGDSVSIGYTLAVRKELDGKANVHRPPQNCGSSAVGLANLERWLGNGRWDVIHFNHGLHDLPRIAVEVMTKLSVQIDDLCAFATPQIDKIQEPGNPHFKAKGTAVLVREIARVIEAALPVARTTAK